MDAVTRWLVELYQKGENRRLEQLKLRIAGHVKIEETKPNRIFSRLAMLCHPDKHAGILKTMEMHLREKDLPALVRFGYFSLILSELRAPEKMESRADPEILRHAGFSHAYGKEDLADMRFDRRAYGSHPADHQDFLSALCEKEYGNAGVETEYGNIDIYDEEIELSGSGIDDLTGVNRCLNLLKLDLSNNAITDIDLLSSLDLIEDLDLSKNHITDILTLKDLVRLRTLDISFNEIEDLSPLLDLTDLEFVNAVGNDIPENSISALRAAGVTVIVSPEKGNMLLN